MRIMDYGLRIESHERARLSSSSARPEQTHLRLDVIAVGGRVYPGDPLSVERNRYNSGRGRAGCAGVERALATTREKRRVMVMVSVLTVSL
jgi:hypothetical protein